MKLLENGNRVVIAFLNLTKQFDYVNHQILCSILSTFGIDIAAAKWIQRFLSNLFFSLCQACDVISSYAKHAVVVHKDPSFNHLSSFVHKYSSLDAGSQFSHAY